MSTLFVCHSIGDTNALLATALTIAKKTEQEIIFLVVGHAAKSIFEKPSTQDLLNEFSSIKVISLTDVFSKEPLYSLENTSLNENQRNDLQTFLKEKNIKNTLIGTPSQLNALVPFQIAEDIATYFKLEGAFIFNDYFFKEHKHAYWDVLGKKEDQLKDWRHKFTWLVPLPEAEKKILNIHPTINTKTVGHPSIDAILEQKSVSKEDFTLCRKLLQITDQNALLFISGTKEISEDIELLHALLSLLDKQEHDNIEVRIGIHPGISNTDLEPYISTLLTNIELFPKAANHIKLIINNSLAKRIDTERLNNPYFIREDISGDTAFAAADGVASALPSTLVNQAAIGGKPAYYHQADKESYLPEDRLFVGEKNFSFFFDQVQAKKHKESATKKELGIPGSEAAETIASMLITK